MRLFCSTIHYIYLYDRIFVKFPISFFFRDMTHIVKSALSRIAEESFKEFLDQDPQADDFEH